MRRLTAIPNFDDLAFESGYQSQVMAWKLGVSTRTLQRYALDHFHEPITDHLRRIRMDKAVEMVATGKPLKEISQALGFTQYTNFCRAFTEHTGASPIHYLEPQIIPPFCKKHRDLIHTRLRSLRRDRRE